MLIYFCILSKVKSHTKHILFCTILIFKEIGYISSRKCFFFLFYFFFFYSVGVLFLSLSWRADLVPEAHVDLVKDMASHRSQYSLYSLHDNEAFEGFDIKIVQNGTRARAS